MVVETAGIGYLLHVANSCLLWQNESRRCTSTCTEWSVKTPTFYGFATEEEKQLFLNLISVSDIGPVSALAIIIAG